MIEPVTKDDLEQAMTELRGEVKDMGAQLCGEVTQLRGEMQEMGTQLRGEMQEMGTQLRGEMKDMGAQLRGEMKDMGAQLRGEMKDMEDRLVQHIEQAASQVANVMVEQLRPVMTAFDEKYQDLPRRHAELRADFEAHAADLRLHMRLPPAPAKRVRRPRSR